MSIATILKTLAAAALISAASFAGAGTMSSASNWTSGGADVTTVTNPSTGSLQLYYYKGDYYCAGCGDHYWSFSTVADKSGIGTFVFTYNAFNGWFMASSDLSIQVNGVTQVWTPGYDVAAAVALNVNAGDTITVLAHEYNYDSTGVVLGTIAMNNFGGAFAADVPEPASIALLGAGLLGAGIARRKRKQA
jgi:hypothetical protein